ncbi:MAG TPA: ABC transporter permease subunit [Candidatus Dormibacteraeota bacterium]|nr:ABC transporter permease subunit [Candidatus Dormibacteraeota bacterium]
MGVVEAAPQLARPLVTGRRRRWLPGYLLCAPAFAAVFGLLLYPIVFDVRLSLTDASHFDVAGRFVGLENYARILTDPTYWEAARNTLALVVVVAAVELFVGMLTALLLWWRFWGRSLVFLAVFVPWAFPSSFSAFAWYWLILPPFHSFYTEQAIQAKFWLDGIFGVGSWQVLSIAVMNVWRGSSIIAIFLLAGFNAIPEELLDYGKLETRSRWRYFWRVVLPLNRRIAVLALMVAITVTYLDFVSMYAESGGRIVVPVVGTLAYVSGILGGQTSYAAALIVTQLPVAILLTWIGLRFIEREPSAKPAPEQHWTLAPSPSRLPAPREGEGRSGSAVASYRAPASTRGSRRRRLARRLAAVGGVAAALAVLAFHLFPVYYTAVQAVRPLSEFSLGQIFWAYHPDLSGIDDAVHNAVLWRWGLNTLLIFGVALVVGLAASLLAGYGLARIDPPGARWLARLMFACYFVPQLAVILPLFQVYNAVGLDNTLLGIVLVYLMLVVPFATWLFYSFFLGLDREIEEHAWLDGNKLQAFIQVVLPMSWPVVIAAALFGIGMMGSDVLYAGLFSLTNDTRTLPAGLGISAIGLDEWANVNAAILLSSLPIVLGCAALGRYYVQGLRAALLEGA